MSILTSKQSHFSNNKKLLFFSHKQNKNRLENAHLQEEQLGFKIQYHLPWFLPACYKSMKFAGKL